MYTEGSSLLVKDNDDQAPTVLDDSQIRVWMGFFAVNYVLSAVLLQ